MSNLSPEQFIQQHADFHRWTKSEEKRLLAEHEVAPGHSSFRNNPDAGRRMSQLRGARVWLEDTYSEAAHEAINYKRPVDKSWLAGPLHDMVDERHHAVVDEYLNRSKQ